MGKRLITQARGKGGPTYRARSFRNVGKTKMPSQFQGVGKVMNLVNCPGHSAPLMEVEYDNGISCLVQAPKGIRIGDKVEAGGTETNKGSILTLQDIPEGTSIYNIESQPGDGGKFCRTSGLSARITGKTGEYALVLLPSKKERKFPLNCRACIGVIAGGGRTEKPILKAGSAHHARRARNKKYPHIRAAAQNAVDHPLGNKRTARHAKQKPVNRFAPPGAKVGKISPKRTGKRK
ncbi:50S ribosomal protein L2 [Candidatus Woesearchaeota archaeon]|jgi:large subunit ribosomal protein L2|nr:50S ribosomal protein L2 [Candidatus Woesearchaeota archaeon]